MDSKDYIEIAKAADLPVLRERALYRVFEALPAIISLGTLFGVFIFSWLKPVWVAIFIILFCFYYLCRIVYFSFHQIASYFRLKKHLKIDWLARLNNLGPTKRWREIYHLIILPTYKETAEIIKESLEALLKTAYPKENIIVVLAIEERAGDSAVEMAKFLEKEYSQKFFRFLITLHPTNISGEIAGKGSNEAWAIKQAKERIIDALKIPYENIIVSSFDIDTKVYPDYFACLTWHFLKVKKPLRASFQPIPIYNNNIWQAPAFSRVVSTSNTFWQMMQQERPEKLVTYSSHAVPFKVMAEVGYPANIVSDDSRIFWKAYLFYDGDYRAVPLYYPVSMDAVMSKNIFRTTINQYKQQRRWSWGCSEIPYLLFGFLKNKKIKFSKKISHLFNIFDGFWSWATAALLIFFGGWLPLFLGGGKFNYTLLSYNLPRLTSQIMTITMIGMVVSAILSMLLLPPRKAGTSRLKYFSVFLQWILLPFTLIAFGSLPALDAQIRLMLGKYLGFWVTEKVRRK